MANEHEGNSRKNNNGRGEGEQTPPPAPKPPATPAELAKAISSVSALLVEYSPNEQLRIIAAVKLTNGLQEQPRQAPPQQRSAAPSGGGGARRS